jgi:hypothetical protein
MVLGTVRQEAGPQKRWQKVLKVKLTQGGPSGSSPLDQMVIVMVRQEARPHERAVKDTQGTLEIQGTYCSRKTGIVMAKRKINLLFLRVRSRREKMKMPGCKPVCHKTE